MEVASGRGMAYPWPWHALLDGGDKLPPPEWECSAAVSGGAGSLFLLDGVPRKAGRGLVGSADHSSLGGHCPSEDWDEAARPGCRSEDYQPPSVASALCGSVGGTGSLCSTGGDDGGDLGVPAPCAEQAVLGRSVRGFHRFPLYLGGAGERPGFGTVPSSLDSSGGSSVLACGITVLWRYCASELLPSGPASGELLVLTASEDRFNSNGFGLTTQPAL